MDSKYSKNSKWGEINKPNYYTNGVECIDVMIQQYGIDAVIQFCICNAFKYMFRCKQKHSSPLDDLKKAQWYINKAIELYEKVYTTTNRD